MQAQWEGANLIKIDVLRSNYSKMTSGQLGFKVWITQSSVLLNQTMSPERFKQDKAEKFLSTNGDDCYHLLLKGDMNHGKLLHVYNDCSIVFLWKYYFILGIFSLTQLFHSSFSEFLRPTFKCIRQRPHTSFPLSFFQWASIVLS